MSELISCSSTQVIDYLRRQFRTKPEWRSIPFITGDPGVGKTAVVGQATALEKLHFFGIRLLQHENCEPTGLPGMQGLDPSAQAIVEWFARLLAKDSPELMDTFPKSKGRTAEWAPFGDFFPIDPDCQCVVFLDEITQLDATQQRIVTSLVDRAGVAGRRIPQGTRFVLAGNRQTDRAGSSRLLTIIENRCTQVEMVFSVDSWMRWAVDHDIHPVVRGFADFAPREFHDFQPARNLNPTARQWEKVSNELRGPFADAPPDREHPELLVAVAGKVGKSAATKFLAFRTHYETLHGVVDQVLEHPDQVEISGGVDELSKQHAIVAAVVERLRERNGKVPDRQLSNVIRLSDRLPTILSSLLCANVFAFTPQCATRMILTPEGQAWLEKHRHTINACRRKSQ